jgi:hypothetical protein
MPGPQLIKASAGAAMGNSATPGSVPEPAAELPPLDRAQVDVLRRVGRHWARTSGGGRNPEGEVTDEVPPQHRLPMLATGVSS